jgi:hypothetical protein
LVRLYIDHNPPGSTVGRAAVGDGRTTATLLTSLAVDLVVAVFA